MNYTTPDETAEKLNAILDTLADKAVADDLFSKFFLLSPIELERVLYRLRIPDAAKAQLLQLSVFQILPCGPVDPVVDNNFQVFLEAVGRTK
jgi:hypothetical protein